MLKTAAAGVALSFVLMGGAALAQTCPAYNFTLTNGANADADQVMNNFNRVRDCVNSLAPLTSPHFTGSVGIGTASPVVPLDVYGPAVIGTDGGYGLYTRTVGGVVRPWFAESGGYTVFYNAGGLNYVFRNQADTATLFALDNVGNSTLYGASNVPNQPAFLASISSSTDANVAVNAPIPFNSTAGSGYNIGGMFNASTGKATVPLTGFYEVNYGIYFTASGSSNWFMQVGPFINSAFPNGGSDAVCTLGVNPSAVGGIINLTTSCVMHFNAGDTVGIAPRTGGGLRHYQGHAYFSMRLLG